MAAQVSGLNSALIYTACNPIVRMVIAQEQTLPGFCNAMFEVTYRTQKIITEMPVIWDLFPKIPTEFPWILRAGSAGAVE